MNGDNVRMIQRGGSPRLAAESGNGFGDLEMAFGQEFQGYIAVEFVIMCPIDLPHPSAPEFFEDEVAAERLANHGDQPAWRHLRLSRRESQRRLGVISTLFLGELSLRRNHLRLLKKSVWELIFLE